MTDTATTKVPTDRIETCGEMPHVPDEVVDLVARLLLDAAEHGPDTSEGDL